MSPNPNFPNGLNIHPSAPPSFHNASSILRTPVADQLDSLEQAMSIEEYGIAGRVWEAAYAMLIYLSTPVGHQFDPPFLDPLCLRPLTIVELGAGTGIVAFQLAEVLAGRDARDTIIMTDLPDVCPLLEQNSAKRFKADMGWPDLRVHPLAWGDAQHANQLLDTLPLSTVDRPRGFTHIICSDLVYFPSLLAPLLRSLLTLTSISVIQPEVIISYKIRSLPKEMPFWSAFGLWFTFQPVLVKVVSDTDTEELKDGVERGWERFGATWDGPTFVFAAHRKEESLRWEVPEVDHDLLAGVGAHGTVSRKGDETFETLLFMQMEEY